MKHYIIDGNNLIGKIHSLKRVQSKEKQSARERLAFIIDNFMHDKKVKCTIHFDGFEQLPIKTSRCKIIYSDDLTADEKIKIQIEQTKNRKNLLVVTSDNNIREFARVCSCDILKSEEFVKLIQSGKTDNEKKIIDGMKNNIDEFKKLFGVDED